MLKVIKYFLLAIIITLIFCSPILWTFRDGLGPDSFPSFGLDALKKTFMTFYAGPVLLAGLALRLGIEYYLKKKN
ncbi:hypothetical protein KAJ27_17935 [bacterium]|nr:hypothetical protein [bacterium]